MKMKVLFPSKEENPGINALMEPILGNAVSFIIMDSDDKSIWKVIKNENLDDENCGLVDYLVEIGVDAVVACQICGHCMDKFAKTKIDLWKCDGSERLRESENKFLMGSLFVPTKPDMCDCPHHN